METVLRRFERSEFVSSCPFHCHFCCCCHLCGFNDSIVSIIDESVLYAEVYEIDTCVRASSFFFFLYFPHRYVSVTETQKTIFTHFSTHVSFQRFARLEVMNNVFFQSNPNFFPVLSSFIQIFFPFIRCECSFSHFPIKKLLMFFKFRVKGSIACFLFRILLCDMTHTF